MLRGASERPLEDGLLGSQPTMSRLETSVSPGGSLLRIAGAIFEHCLNAFGDSPPPMICIDMDPGAHPTCGQ